MLNVFQSRLYIFEINPNDRLILSILLKKAEFGGESVVNGISFPLKKLGFIQTLLMEMIES